MAARDPWFSFILENNIIRTQFSTSLRLLNSINILTIPHSIFISSLKHNLF